MTTHLQLPRALVSGYGTWISAIHIAERGHFLHAIPKPEDHSVHFLIEGTLERITLKANNGKYVTCHESNQVYLSTRVEVGSYWHMTLLEGGTKIILRSAYGSHLGVEPNGVVSAFRTPHTRHDFALFTWS
eukprot:TRINITY_DN116_c0_g1_i3.p1 TRINITY_DN116_c0_g1~~TRINITY_DN116_c0_g1_i3.p1  ORF type:complete len:131 (+),score=2.25 TRINITY_DN116_c0_g1_i3:396-788(+)